MVVAGSTNIQNGTQDPYEQVFRNPSFPPGSRIVIVKKTGAADRFLHLNTNRGRLSIGTTGQTRGQTRRQRLWLRGDSRRGGFPESF